MNVKDNDTHVNKKIAYVSLIHNYRIIQNSTDFDKTNYMMFCMPQKQVHELNIINQYYKH